MLGYDNLSGYFRTNFTLMHEYKWDISIIENMIPWERTVYVDLLNEQNKILEEQARDRAAINKRR